MIKTPAKKDIVLIGGGIMSATLGVLLKQIDPTIRLRIYERLDKVAEESSEAWNNAGTGHSAFCELNYTPERKNGHIDVSKAVKIASAFEVSKEFWAHLVRENAIESPERFIRQVPHVSFVWGADNVNFLRRRYQAMRVHPLFEDMEYTEAAETLTQWMPLVMEGRDTSLPVAATRMMIGTDVDFGVLTEILFEYLKTFDDVSLALRCEVRDLDRADDGRWEVEIEDLDAEETIHTTADFVFIGAGGGALPLLQKANIDEAEGYGGFPISGQWLVCKKPAVIARHDNKVYGRAEVGAPPMSVPHLDRRVIAGQPALLFGPFAGFSTKFLKNGSYWDLPASIEFCNLFPMLAAGWNNLPLTRYLLQQVTQSQEDRMEALRTYYPAAKDEDWELAIAGQRVQVIKKDDQEIGILEFGTELVFAKDGSIAALLGASPGASTAVSAMLDVLKQCFPHEMRTRAWRNAIKHMTPSYGTPLNKQNRIQYTRTVLQAPLGLSTIR